MRKENRYIRNDGTLVYHGVVFDVGQEHAGRKVTVEGVDVTLGGIALLSWPGGETYAIPVGFTSALEQKLVAEGLIPARA